MSVVTRIDQLDYRLPQAGRIRTGEQVKARSGKMRPVAMDTFKFTSGERELLEPLAKKYGGTIAAWNVPGSGDKWQVKTNATKIDVQVHVAGSVSLAYELWDPHLERRCNGDQCQVVMTSADDAGEQTIDCLCARRGVLECQKIMRLSVLLPKMPSLGAWRFDTHSENTITETLGFMKYMQEWAGNGLHECTMRIEERRRPGKVFKVVVLDYEGGIESLLAGESRLVQLPTPTPPTLGELEAGASSVTLPHPEAGEPMAGEAGEVEPAPPVGPSPASPPSDDVREQLLTMRDEIYGRSVIARSTDDDIVDAELVDEIDEVACATWLEATKASGRLSSKALIQGRKLSIEAGLPAPMTIDDLTVEIIDQLRKAGDDEHARARADD
jgi:hypothetical protein